MDASASRELWRHAHSNILVVNPVAPALFHLTATPEAPAAATSHGPGSNGAGPSGE